jgi:hypothetical protein
MSKIVITTNKMIEVKINSCQHDYLRILTNDYGKRKFEGDYECTICGDIKTKKELDELGIFYTD